MSDEALIIRALRQLLRPALWIMDRFAQPGTRYRLITIRRVERQPFTFDDEDFAA